MIEVKCPFWRRRDHPRGWRRHSSIPHSYYLQMNTLLEVCDREWCDFVSYCEEGMYVARVKRDRDLFTQSASGLGLSSEHTYVPFSSVNKRDKFRVTVSELSGWGLGLGLHTGDKPCQGVMTLDASGRVPDTPLPETCPGQDRARA